METHRAVRQACELRLQQPRSGGMGLGVGGSPRWKKNKSQAAERQHYSEYGPWRGYRLFLDDGVVAFSHELYLHRFGFGHGRERSDLHVIELVVGNGIVDHEDVVILPAQRAG